MVHDHHHNHEDLIKSIAKEYQGVLKNSMQAMYIFLDDLNKVCNKKFAALLGYKSEEEWAKIDQSFPEAFVAEESQQALVAAYQEAMDRSIGSTNKIVWKKKDGSTVNTTVILVPIVYEGHLFALHFINKKV